MGTFSAVRIFSGHSELSRVGWNLLTLRGIRITGGHIPEFEDRNKDPIYLHLAGFVYLVEYKNTGPEQRSHPW